MASKPVPFSRAPDGVVTQRPVLMRLLPIERAALQRHAKASNCSLSAFARRMTLAGLTQYDGYEYAQRVSRVTRKA